MKERAEGLKGRARRCSRADGAAEDETAVVAEIAQVEASDRAVAEPIHAVGEASAPTWRRSSGRG